MAKNQGIKSRNNREVGVRTGRGARAIIPAGASQLGARQGNHITEAGATRYGGVNLYSRGPGYNKAQYGNEVALNVKGGGPGAGREIFKTGSQCMTGPVNRGEPMTPKREIFPGFGKR